VIRAGYALLRLVTFFGVGPKEAHAWTIEEGTKRRKQPARSTPTSRKALSARKRSPMPISPPMAAKSGHATPAACASKAQTTSSRMATSCASGSTSSSASGCAGPRLVIPLMFL
jgi:hypothetical protein